MPGGGQSAQRATAREQSLLRKADSDAKRLAAADEASQRGDVRVAGLIYVRLALTRPPNPTTTAARQKLAQLQTDADKKSQELDLKLTGDSQPPDDAADSDVRIADVFRRYDELIEKYGALPRVGQQIKGHVAKLRRQPQYAAVLDEPAAAKLWELAGGYERDGHLCCAYWACKQAAQLVPAPSAVLAQQRYAALKQDPKIVASAETCRDLQWCHQAYRQATGLSQLNPQSAKAVFAQIVRRAPADSEVSRAARRQIE
jgi:hypothetical protein